MSLVTLNDFKPQFDNSYQEIFQKVATFKEVANFRFESTLSFGESVERVSIDISGVQVRNTVRNSASTIDVVTDSAETLLIDIEKEATFHISDGVVKQAGSLNPGEKIGAEIAMKVALDIDGIFYAQVRNAAFKFDTGDLTTGTSSGVPITLTATTVPQMTTRMSAKLRSRANQNISTNMLMVTDSYAASDITQFIIGKNVDLASNTFQNGYSGDVNNARLIVSETLQGEATLTSTGVFVDTQTITINGLVFTTVASIGAVAGNVLLGANAAATLTNLTALINAPTVTTATGVAFTVAADIGTASQLSATTSATVMTVLGRGTGRLILAETQTNASWTTNFIHSYYGKKGAIDMVVMDLKEVDMRPTADRRGTNVFSSYLAGIRTFSDGSRKFLDVLINVL